jgi:hypothetical protein
VGSKALVHLFCDPVDFPEFAVHTASFFGTREVEDPGGIHVHGKGRIDASEQAVHAGSEAFEGVLRSVLDPVIRPLSPSHSGLEALLKAFCLILFPLRSAGKKEEREKDDDGSSHGLCKMRLIR